MVLSCLKPKERFLALKNKVFSYSQRKRFKCLSQLEKMHSGKILKQKEEIVNKEIIVLILIIL